MQCSGHKCNRVEQISCAWEQGLMRAAADDQGTGPMLNKKGPGFAQAVRAVEDIRIEQAVPFNGVGRLANKSIEAFKVMPYSWGASEGKPGNGAGTLRVTCYC